MDVWDTGEVKKVGARGGDYVEGCEVGYLES